MNQRHKNARYYICTGLLASLAITGCSNDSSTPPPAPTPASFEVTVVNATNNQPLSPVAVITHSADYSAWMVGSPASTDLEQLAEGGSNAELFTSLSGDTASASGAGAIGPGSSETISITAGTTTQTLLTVVTMLVNTNDAFAGLRSVDVSSMASGDSMTLNAKVYDAGTELNSEATGTMPGPVEMGTGEGFNAARSDVNDFVRGHGGVVTADDGLSSSVLNQSHRFDNPGMIVTITRL